MPLAPVQAELCFLAMPPMEVAVGHYTVDEGLSRPMVMDLWVHVHSLAGPGDVDLTSPEAWLGQRATLTLLRDGETATTSASFTGVVSACSIEGYAPDGSLALALTCVHPLALLTHTMGSEVFVERSAVHIVTALIQAALPAWVQVHAAQDVADEAPKPWVLRYQESTLDFCHRILADEGVGYNLWEDDTGILHMTLFRSLQALMAARELVDCVLPWTADGGAEGPCLHSLSRAQHLVAPHTHLASFDATQRVPTTAFAARSHVPWPGGAQGATYAHSTVLNRDFVAPRYTRNAGEAAVQHLATHATATAHRGTHGASNALGLAVGGPLCVGPQNDAQAALSARFWVTHVLHTGDGGHMEGAYTNHITLLPHAIAYSPAYALPPKTPLGIQSATVVGAGDSMDPYVDDAGRILVRLAWPALQPDAGTEDVPPFWARVTQGWAGSKMGTFFWPRPGMEVLLGFMGAHNEEPLVLSCAYNATNSPPNLPSVSAGISGIRTESLHAMGGASELTFDDTAGEETVSVVAHRHLKTKVGDTLVTTVGEKSAFARLLKVATAVPLPFGSKASPELATTTQAAELVATTLNDERAHALRGLSTPFWTGEKKLDVAQAGLALLTPSAIAKLPPAIAPLAQGALATARCVSSMANLLRKQPWALKLSVFGNAILNISQDVALKVTGKTQVTCEHKADITLHDTLHLQAKGMQVQTDETIQLDAKKRALFQMGDVTLSMENGRLTICGAHLSLKGDTIEIVAKKALTLRGGKVAIN